METSVGLAPTRDRVAACRFDYFGFEVELARSEGFEPPSPWFVATCTNPLCYERAMCEEGSGQGTKP